MARASARQKLLLFCLYSAMVTVFYIYPNRAPLFSPLRLSILQIDRAIPFLPESFPIYISDYLLGGVVLVSLKDLDSVNSFARMALAALVVCGIFFIFLPTTYPRPVYLEAHNSLVRLAMWLVRFLDTPNNCFPSLHVAITVIAAWSFRHRNRWVGRAISLWAGLILISTLTTKQHYFVDVVGGIVVAVSVAAADYQLFLRKHSIHSKTEDSGPVAQS